MNQCQRSPVLPAGSHYTPFSGPRAECRAEACRQEDKHSMLRPYNLQQNRRGTDAPWSSQAEEFFEGGADGF